MTIQIINSILLERLKKVQDGLNCNLHLGRPRTTELRGKLANTSTPVHFGIVHREYSRVDYMPKTISRTNKLYNEYKNSLYKLLRKGRSRAQTLKAQTRREGLWSISEFCQRAFGVSKSRGSKKAKLPILQSLSTHIDTLAANSTTPPYQNLRKKGNNLFGVVRFKESKLPASLYLAGSSFSSKLPTY